MFLLPAQTTQKCEKCVRNIWRTSRKRHALWTFLLLDVVYICYSYSYMCAFSLSCVTCPDYYITDNNNAYFACLLFLSQLSPRVWVARVDSVTGHSDGTEPPCVVTASVSSWCVCLHSHGEARILRRIWRMLRLYYLLCYLPEKSVRAFQWKPSPIEEMKIKRTNAWYENYGEKRHNCEMPSGSCGLKAASCSINIISENPWKLH